MSRMLRASSIPPQSLQHLPAACFQLVFGQIFCSPERVFGVSLRIQFYFESLLLTEVSLLDMFAAGLDAFGIIFFAGLLH